MLLRRFSKHVGDQNWLAVVLDFLVVIAGVFFAMQAENWYSAQQDRDQERKILERLHRDFTGVERNARKLVRASTTAFSSADHLVKILDGSDTDEHSDAVMESLILNAMVATLPPGPVLSQQEIVSSGQVSLITDPALLSLLNQFETRRAYYDRSYDMISETLQPIRTGLYDWIVPDDSLSEEGYVEFDGIAAMDLDGLLSQPGLLNDMAVLRRMNGQNQKFSQMTRDDAHAVLIRIETLLKRPLAHFASIKHEPEVLRRTPDSDAADPPEVAPR